MAFSSLYLGFHYHIPAYQNRAGEICMPGYLGRFVDSLAEQCVGVVCFQHSPLSQEVAFMDYAIQSPKVTWVDLGPHVSLPKRLMRLPHVVQSVRTWRNRLDALLIRGPSPLLPAVARAAGRVPLALLLVGDYVAGVDDLPQPWWRKELIRLWARWNQRQQLTIARRSLTFVNSHKLYEQLRPYVPNLYETRTTTLTATDFYVRNDTCLSPPYHLLYTGRMDRAKGLFDMVEALALLVAQGQDVVLDLVGWPEKGDTILSEIQQVVQASGVAGRVIYHGFKPVGPKLFAYYQGADIYVIASTLSEGFPRTIWEAMAHSLPVVATTVGAIPMFLKDGVTARLVPPENSDLLAQAILEIIRNQVLRQSLIDQGAELARQNTLERRAQEMISQLEQWLKQL